MSEVSSLTLALAMFHKNDLRVTGVNKTHPKFYHLTYRMHGVNRVMLVPKHCDSYQQLQSEVEVLIKRTLDEQKKIGALDGSKE
jgi:hypothetical protein